MYIYIYIKKRKIRKRINKTYLIKIIKNNKDSKDNKNNIIDNNIENIKYLSKY